MTSSTAALPRVLAVAVVLGALHAQPALAQDRVSEPAVVSRSRNASGVLAPSPVQSQHVRTMLVTCKFDETLRFYRDVLGQKVLSDDGGRPATVGQKIIDMPDDGRLRMAVLQGSGEYPAGPVIGSRIGILGLADPKAPACKDMNRASRRLPHGGVIMPIRVSNMPEIIKRARAMGIEIIKEGPSPSRLTYQTLLYDPNGVVLELFELHVTPIP